MVLHCETVYCCWMTFAEYIYNIGNAHDMHSIVQGGSIPCGKSLKRDRQSVFFTAVNPMYANQYLEEVQYDLDKPRISVYRNTWQIHQNTVYWCNLKFAQRKGLQFHQTRSHAIALCNKQLATCIEKVVYMKTGEDFYCKVHQSPKLPRVVLTPNLQYGRQDPLNPEARKSTVTSILKKITERSTRILVAVTLITEFKVYPTQQFRKKTRIARTPSKD